MSDGLDASRRRARRNVVLTAAIAGLGDDFAARATLAKIRVDDPDTIDRELEEIKGSLDEKPGAWSDLLQPLVKAALVVGVGLAILQQVTGINTVIYYRQRSSNSPASTPRRVRSWRRWAWA